MNWYWVSDLRIVAKIHGWVIVLGLFFLMCSCFYVPALRDDYSGMQDDVFTETILKVRRSSNGRLVIDRFEGESVGRDFFKDKDIKYISRYFSEAGGICRSNEVGEGGLLCELDRKWKYKNVGAHSDPSTWCVPGLKLVYGFKFSNEHDAQKTWSDLEFGTEDSTVCSFRGK